MASARRRMPRCHGRESRNAMGLSEPEREAGERERGVEGWDPASSVRATLYLLLELVDRARKGTAPHALLPPLVREHANDGA